MDERHKKILVALLCLSIILITFVGIIVVYDWDAGEIGHDRGILIGEWLVDDEEYTVIFYKDGSYSSNGMNGSEISGIWAVDEYEKRITVERKDGYTNMWGYRLVDDQGWILILYDIVTGAQAHSYKRIGDVPS